MTIGKQQEVSANFLGLGAKLLSWRLPPSRLMQPTQQILRAGEMLIVVALVVVVDVVFVGEF